MAELDRRTRTFNLLIRFVAFIIYLVIGLLVFKAIENTERPDKVGGTHHVEENHTRDSSALEELKLNITRRFNISGSEFDRLAEAIFEAEEQEHGIKVGEHHEDEKEHHEEGSEHHEEESEHHEEGSEHHEEGSEHHEEGLSEHHEYGSEHHDEGWWREEKMTYHESFTLAFHVVTTIGYGHVTPITAAGKAFCVFYAIFGIPLAFLFFCAVGDELYIFQKYAIRKLETGPLKKEVATRLELKCLFLTLLEIFLLLIIGGGIQSGAEGWAFGQGMYCWFVTFTTIGFGDVVPGMDKESHEIPMVFFTIVGLCVMANLVHIIVDFADGGAFQFGSKRERGERLTMEPMDSTA